MSHDPFPNAQPDSVTVIMGNPNNEASTDVRDWLRDNVKSPWSAVLRGPDHLSVDDGQGNLLIEAVPGTLNVEPLIDSNSPDAQWEELFEDQWQEGEEALFNFDDPKEGMMFKLRYG